MGEPELVAEMKSQELGPLISPESLEKLQKKYVQSVRVCWTTSSGITVSSSPPWSGSNPCLSSGVHVRACSCVCVCVCVCVCDVVKAQGLPLVLITISLKLRTCTVSVVQHFCSDSHKPRKTNPNQSKIVIPTYS